MTHLRQGRKAFHQGTASKGHRFILRCERDQFHNRTAAIHYNDIAGMGSFSHPITCFHVQITNRYPNHVLNVTHFNSADKEDVPPATLAPSLVGG